MIVLEVEIKETVLKAQFFGQYLNNTIFNAVLVIVAAITSHKAEVGGIEHHGIWWTLQLSACRRCIGIGVQQPPSWRNVVAIIAYIKVTSINCGSKLSALFSGM